VPDHVDLCMLFFPDKKSYAEAAYRIGESEIAYNFIRVSPGGLVYCMVPHLFGKMAKAEAIRKVLKSLEHCVMLALVADSEGELEYKEKAVNAILRDTGGFCIRSRDFRLLGEWTLLSFLRSSITPLIFRMGGAFGATLAGDDTLDSQLRWAESAAEVKRRWISKKGIVDDINVNNFFLLPYENNNLSHCEEIFMYDPRDRSQSEQFLPINADFLATLIENCMEPIMMSIVPEVRQVLSPLMGNFNRWQKEISAALDPGEAADTGFYTGEAEFDFSLLGEDITERLGVAVLSKAQGIS
jgi:hypothetical protein